MREQRAPQQQQGTCNHPRLAGQPCAYCAQLVAASLPEIQPPLAEQVHAIMTARVEDVGMQFYAPAPESQPSPSGDEQRLRDLLQGLVKHFRDDFEDPGLELYGLVNGKELRVGGQMLNKLLAEAEAALQEIPSEPAR